MRRAVIIALLVSAPAAPAPAGGFMRGVDASFLPQVEAGGGTYREGAAPADALAVLRDHGIDTIRIRLWHAPVTGDGGLPQALALARRAADHGFGILLDIHYSDTWADPAHQAPPAAWAGLPLPALADSVRMYTRDVVRAFADQGAPPRVVQLGNEVTGGLLWDAGRVGGAFDDEAHWDALARLLAAGAEGIDEALPPAARPRVMLHLDRGGDNAGARRWLDRVTARGARFDVIGLSYYPWWHGTPAQLAGNVADLAARYGKDVAVVETAYPWTLGWQDATPNIVGLPSQLLPEFPASPAGQAAFAAGIVDIVRNVPDGRGAGVVWWAGDWITAPRAGSAWENLALFDEEGRALPALSTLGGEP